MYCGVAVLVIANGQSTTDDDIEKDEIGRLVDMVEVLRAELATTTERLINRIAKLESQLADEKSHESKFDHTCDLHNFSCNDR